MNTPIYDFVNEYSNSKAVRFHMPGHKGVDSLLGVEHLDITEFDGADNLWDADGIIKESEDNASSLFGAKTFYSTEGSSLCIRAMLFMIKKWAYKNNVSPFILAARNAHKTFINAAAILDINVDWLMPKETDTYESCSISADDVETCLAKISSSQNIYTHNDGRANESSTSENSDSCNGDNELYRNVVTAVYITSPDYLGNMLDIKAISEVCHKHGVLLIVDNAHGSYLKFLEPSLHPIDLGADMCCDSAHKTLPALTGAAYLHVALPGLTSDGLNESCNASSLMSGCSTCDNASDYLSNNTIKQARNFLSCNAKDALSLFASTSPSYLILQSLDLTNKYLSESKNALFSMTETVKNIKKQLLSYGYILKGTEPLKITIDTASYGYTGDEVAKILISHNIFLEYHDKNYIVLMVTTATKSEDLELITGILSSLPRREALKAIPCIVKKPEQRISPSRALYMESEIIPSSESKGRVLAESAVSCPPCVPVYMAGEVIDELPPSEFVKVIK